MKTEKEIGKKAVRMLQSALRDTAKKTFKQHILNQKNGMERLENVVAKEVIKTYKNRLNEVSKDVQFTYYLRMIKVKMARAGFVQHYGADTVRSGHFRTHKGEKKIVKPHEYKLASTAWIDKAVENSRVMDLLGTEISDLRGQKVILMVKHALEEK